MKNAQIKAAFKRKKQIEKNTRYYYTTDAAGRPELYMKVREKWKNS